MSDNNIIKALECCMKDCVRDCDDCPYDEIETETYCANDLIKDALDLINRQKAEVERLQKESHHFADIGKMYSELRAEAIKEYVDEVQKRCIESGIYPVIVKNIMEEVRKEMVGE